MNDLAELHRHLDGSLRPSTLAELAESQGLEVPSDLRFYQGMGLDEALARFRFTLSLLQDADAVRRVAAEMCEDAEIEGITTLEIRFAPQLHHGAAPADIVDAALDGIGDRAGLVLCGLWGEPPAVLDGLVAIGADRQRVVGIDLAGGPASDHSWRLEDYVEPFRRAREMGLGRTVHAGEGRPAEEIRVAIERLRAQRIGHGTTLLEDPRVLDLVLERDIAIEACLTSNVHTGAVAAVELHPLARWLDLGVKACVCADNTLLSGVDLPTELDNASRIPGMSPEKMSRIISNGHAAAFG